MGSAPVSPGLIEPVRRGFPGAVGNGYGTTEAGPVVFAPHPDGRPDPDLALGVPHPEVELRLVARRGRRRRRSEGRAADALPGVDERLSQPARGDGQGDDRRTASIAPATCSAATSDGFFYFVGRADDMFVSGGENIYPGEVEKMLERHPDIHQAAVVPVDDELKCQKPIAFVVHAPGAAAERGGGKEPMRWPTRRPTCTRVACWFCREMPLAGTNKIDKRVLAQQIPAAGET